MLSRSLIFALCLLCAGCASRLSQDAAARGTPVQAHDFRFADGGNALYFVLDKGKDVLAQRAPQTLMFVVPGSDCIGMRPFLPQYFDGLEGRSGPIRIFILHKRFIGPRSDGRDCGDAFIDADHPSRWLADQREFISVQLRMAEDNGQAPARVVVLGISEGGEVAPLLARHLARITHVALLANGGMNPADSFRLQARRHGFEAEAAAVEARCAAAPPDAQAAGRSCRYWTEMLALDHTGTLRGLSVPILVAMGEEDALVPADSARYLAERFAADGKQNLSLLLFPGADHGFTRIGGSFLPYLWEAIDQWLME